MYILADLLPYATFGNKENKGKRKAAENRMSIDRVYTDADAFGADPAELAKRKASELRIIRERRQLDIVDPLQYRSKQKGKKKIIAPYTDNTGSYYLPEWQEKGTSQKLGREQNRGGNYIGSSTRLSDNPKRQARVDEILKNQSKPKSKPTVPVSKIATPKTEVNKVMENFTKVPEVKFTPPKSKTKVTIDKVKEVVNSVPTSTPKGKGRLGLLSAGALGLAGIGGALYLANRRKKEKKND